MQRFLFEVDGIHSDKCKTTLSEQLAAIGAKDVAVEVTDAKKKKGKVRFSTDREARLFHAVIESVGNYTVTSHKEE